MSLVKPTSSVVAQRHPDPTGLRSNRLTQNTNAAYDDYDVGWWKVKKGV